jgi:hypothetical protein
MYSVTNLKHQGRGLEFRKVEGAICYVRLVLPHHLQHVQHVSGTWVDFLLGLVCAPVD